MNALTIANTSVRQLDGLFSLNDLHQSAGGEKKHQPSDFLRTNQTQELISEIEHSGNSRITPVKVIKGNYADGRTQGTYVCKELVYAYAMWISAKFHLQVIRAFDALQTGAVPPAPTFALSDAIAIYRESMGALLMVHTKKEAHVLACVGATRATGFDLASMWAPTVKPVATRPPKAPLLPWDNPEKRLLDKLARYLRNATRLPRPKDMTSFTAQQCARLLDHGYIPRQTLLKVMHVPASKFNLLIAEGKESGIVRELDGIEFNYAGTVYVAGGAA